MTEVSYRLPPLEVLLEQDGATRLDMARVAIAGFTEWEDGYDGGSNYGEWPFPLFLLDGNFAHDSRVTSTNVIRTYWHLKGNVLTPELNVLSQVQLPLNNDDPWVYIGSAMDPPDTRAYIFDSPIPYDQTAFVDAVAREFIKK